MSAFRASRIRVSGRRAVERAAAALSDLAIAPDDTPRQVERIAGLWASGVRRRLRKAARAWLGAATTFDVEHADAVYALAAYAALKQNSIECDALRGHASVFAAALGREHNVVPSDLALACRLLHLGGFRVPKAEPSTSPALPRNWLLAPRSEHMGICRNIAAVTAWGLYPMDGGELSAILPVLCVSYARDWDIEAVSALLRACNYLNLPDQRPCEWARAWLLDQQCEDGHFGLFGPECVAVGRDPEDPYLRLSSTVAAVLALSNGSAWRNASAPQVTRRRRPGGRKASGDPQVQV